MEDLILAETPAYIVINKPAGLMVHPDGKSNERCLTDLLLEYHPELRGIGEPMEITYKGEVITIMRPGIVHRLDKETSGVMVIAKTQAMFLFLKRQFQDHTIKKVYHAFVCGSVKHDMGTIDAPIGRSTKDVRKWNAGRGARGTLREAVTRYRTLARFSEANLPYSLVEVYPLTGRTHQIRVHFRYINHPLVADTLYAPQKPRALGFERLALHARTLTFTDQSGNTIIHSAPFPEDMVIARGLAGVAEI